MIRMRINLENFAWAYFWLTFVPRAMPIFQRHIRKTEISSLNLWKSLRDLAGNLEIFHRFRNLVRCLAQWRSGGPLSVFRKYFFNFLVFCDSPFLSPDPTKSPNTKISHIRSQTSSLPCKKMSLFLKMSRYLFWFGILG